MSSSIPLWTSDYVKAWTCNFIIFFAFMLMTPLLPLYLKDSFSADKDTIGLVLSGYTVTALMFRSVGGWLVDSLPRHKVLLVSWLFFSLFFAGYFLTTTIVLFAVVRTLHGVPFATVTVSNSTAAIDVLPSERRAEGIGYFGLSNNLATAIAPTIGLAIYECTRSFDLIFGIALAASLLGVWLGAGIRLKPRTLLRGGEPVSLDRFFLKRGWALGVSMAAFALAYGILATYLAIFCRETLGSASGSGNFFLILSLSLICSRIVGGRSLRKGRIVENASFGVLFSILGYGLFAWFHTLWACYLAAFVIGLGNGHMFPAFNNMFVNLAPPERRGTANATLLTMWDLGMGLGTVCGGALADAYGYTAAFALSAISQIFGATAFFALARRRYILQRLTPS